MCKKKKGLRVLLFRFECYNFVRLDIEKKKRKRSVKCNNDTFPRSD